MEGLVEEPIAQPATSRPLQRLNLPGLAKLLIPLFLFYLCMAALLPGYEDELYYWCWAQDLQLSYYDHAPMVAWIIAGSTAVFGNSIVATRLPAILCALVAVAVIYQLSRPRSLLPYILITPAILLVGLVITPDSPLFAFWSLYLFWLVKLHERLEDDAPPVWMWLVGGVVLGGCILSKYTAGLAIPCGLASFLFVRNWRSCVLGYALHIGVAFVVTLPILIYNIQENFAPLLYQWHHVADNEPWSLKPIGEFLGMQALAAGLLPFVTFFWAMRHFRRLAEQPRLRVCLCMFVLPFAFFIYKGTRLRLEANWPLISYIAVWPLAAAWYEEARQSLKWRVSVACWFTAPILVVAVLLIHCVWPIAVVPPRVDRITRQVGKDALAAALADKLPEAGPPAPLFVGAYQWTALLRFHGIDAREINNPNRPSHFTRKAVRITDFDRAYVLTDDNFGPDLVGDMKPRVVAQFSLTVRGETISVLNLIEYTKPGAAQASNSVTGR